MRADDVPHVITAAQRTAGALAKPCTCSRPDCRTIGDHIWHATRDARPGIAAANLEPSRASAQGLPLPQPDLDGTGHAHVEYRRLLTAYGTATMALEHFLAPWRPDRESTTDVADPTDWCAHHLAMLGTHEPRYRGDLCRRCYGFQLAEKDLPPVLILQAWHRSIRVTDTMVRDALRETRAAKTTGKRRKKGRK